MDIQTKIDELIKDHNNKIVKSDDEIKKNLPPDYTNQFKVDELIKKLTK